MFMPLHGLPFGFSSSVNTFNRFPTLLVAVIRRVFAVMGAAYFDDMPLVDAAMERGTAQAFVRFVLKAVGSPPAKLKSVMMGH